MIYFGVLTDKLSYDYWTTIGPLSTKIILSAPTKFLFLLIVRIINYLKKIYYAPSWQI